MKDAGAFLRVFSECKKGLLRNVADYVCVESLYIVIMLFAVPVPVLEALSARLKFAVWGMS